MTAGVQGVGAITKKSRCRQLLLPVEIPAARFSCLTSGSFRPKLGLCILLIVLIACLFLVILPLLSDTSYGPFSIFSSSSTQSKTSRHKTKMFRLELEYPVHVGKVAKGNNEFNKKLYSQLAASKNENVIFSPISVESVMSMLLAGAKGETETQIRTALCLPDDDLLHTGLNEILEVMRDEGFVDKETNFTIQLANRIYTHKDYVIKNEFLELNKKLYYVEPESVDFVNNGEHTRGMINTWVKQETNDKIKDLLPPNVITPDTRLVLVNALYFKGDWEDKFDPKNTRKQDFHTSNGEVVKVDM